MTPCADWLPLLSDRAAGALAAGEAERLDTHLAGCAACRAEAEALAAVLSMAALPPTAPAEQEALTGLAEAVRLEQRRAELRRRTPLRYAAAVLAVAAAVAFLVAPAFTRRAPDVGTAFQVGATAAAWEAPDADEIWTASDLASDDGSTAAMSGADELALAVLLADD